MAAVVAADPLLLRSWPNNVGPASSISATASVCPLLRSFASSWSAHALSGSATFFPSSSS
jgi:hypothetical protein